MWCFIDEDDIYASNKSQHFLKIKGYFDFIRIHPTQNWQNLAEFSTFNHTMFTNNCLSLKIKEHTFLCILGFEMSHANLYGLVHVIVNEVWFINRILQQTVRVLIVYKPNNFIKWKTRKRFKNKNKSQRIICFIYNWHNDGHYEPLS